jgi:hypothetical protein
MLLLRLLCEGEVDVVVGAADGRLEVRPRLLDAAHAELFHAQNGARRVVAVEGGARSALNGSRLLM